MASSYEIIQQALNAHLYAMTGLPTVIWPNQDAETPANKPYLVAHMVIASEPRQAGIGTNSRNRLAGIFQVDVHFQRGANWPSATGLVDDLCDQFKRGTTLTRSGVTVKIEKAWPGPLIYEANIAKQPVSIQWRSYVEN